MSLGTPVVTVPGNAGFLKTKTYNFLAQDAATVARTLDQPQASGYVTTSGSETGAVIDLTAQGFTFLADHIYQIVLRGQHSNDANRWVQTWVQSVLGGTTPVLLGSAKLLNAFGRISTTEVQYGEISAQATYSGDTATAVAANSTAGSSLGNNATNTVTLTHPIARTSPKWFSAQPGRAAAAVAGARTADIVAATSTTATVFISDLATPSVALVMSTNNVQVHVGYDATDLIQHYVDVFIGEPQYLPFGA